MNGFLNLCCTFDSNRRTIGNVELATKCEIVVCNVCGTSYTKRVSEIDLIIAQSKEPITKTEQTK